MARFAIPIAPAHRPLLAVAGMGPSSCYVDVTGDTVEVRMGPTFSAALPRAAVVDTAVVTEGRARRLLGGIGVHGWRGHWRANGAFEPLVRISLAPEQRARLLGIPIRLHTLDVGTENPGALIAELAKDR